MEKHLNSYDKECMKMAMLKHEETFREQVYELHRLYKMQILLMKELSICDLGNSRNSNQYSTHKRQRLSLDLEHLAEEDQTELELTLGPTNQCKQKRIINNNNNNTSDSAASFSSSSSTLSNCIKSCISESDQRMINISKERLSVHNWSLEIPNSKSKPERKDGSEDEEQQLKQNRHGNPSWLFQGLTLNTTRKNHLQLV